VILAMNDDLVLELVDGKLDVSPEDDKVRRLFNGRKLRTRRAVAEPEVEGLIAEELVEAVTPGEKTRALITLLRLDLIRDDGDA
jgi:hypothetical protein